MITAGIATIKERESLFREAISSVYSQVDSIIAVLNNYDSVPKWLSDMPKVKALVGDNSLGDAGKFLEVDNVPDGVYFSIDDDLLYPDGYVDYMISKIEQYHCIVTLHGKRYDSHPIQSFKRGKTLNIHCLNTCTKDAEVHLGGTGVMAFATKDFKLSIKDFPKKNMADIWVGKKAKEQGVKIMAVEHSRYFLKYLNPKGDTIWNSNKDDVYQASVLRSFLP